MTAPTWLLQMMINLGLITPRRMLPSRQPIEHNHFPPKLPFRFRFQTEGGNQNLSFS